MQRIQIRVVPNASRDEIVGRVGDSVKVKLQAVPEGGRANRSLLALLADRWGCRPRDLCLLSGQKSRTKVVGFPESLDPNDLLQ